MEELHMAKIKELEVAQSKNLKRPISKLRSWNKSPIIPIMRFLINGSKIKLNLVNIKTFISWVQNDICNDLYSKLDVVLAHQNVYKVLIPVQLKKTIGSY